MKNSILVAAIVAYALSASTVSAQEKAAPAKPAMSMGMAQPMPQMQANMKNMQEQMEKVRTTTDPTERQKLMQAHMQTMQDTMTMMRGMGGAMMMGGGKGGTKAADMATRQGMMEQRMDMMQMMMEQMIQHDRTMESTPAK